MKHKFREYGDYADTDGYVYSLFDSLSDLVDYYGEQVHDSFECCYDLTDDDGLLTLALVFGEEPVELYELEDFSEGYIHNIIQNRVDLEDILIDMIPRLPKFKVKWKK